MRAALGIVDGVTSLAPNDLISAILKAPVDLLWNGGIGTYAKATAESNADVGDKANDGLRVNAADLRCKVIGEGGNLGFTQLARIEFALRGGLVNTDFIDNSAGVDTSDHEVNIKILLDEAVREGDLTEKQRNQLLAEMTGEVGDLVLRDNHAQNVVLAAARKQAADMLHIHTRYLRRLERQGQLNRALEFLPSDKALAERRQSGLGLTAPEFSVLLAYTKLVVDQEILASDLPDDPALREWLVSYFPSALRGTYQTYMDNHPLRREIITTGVANDLVNSGGTSFVFRFHEELGASTADIARAYLVTRQVFDLPAFRRQVEGLDNRIDVDTQLAMLLEGRKLSERGTRWLLNNRRPPLDLAASARFFADGAAALLPHLPKLLTGPDLTAFEERRDQFIGRGVPDDLAERVAAMVPAYSTFDLVEIAVATDRPVSEVAEVYFDLADRVQLARLRERVISLPRDSRWNTMARSALRDDLYAAHASLTRDVLIHSKPGEAPGGAPGPLVGGERGGRDQVPADPVGDLGERRLRPGDPVGGPPRDQDTGRDQRSSAQQLEKRHAAGAALWRHRQLLRGGTAAGFVGMRRSGRDGAGERCRALLGGAGLGDAAVVGDDLGAGPWRCAGGPGPGTAGSPGCAGL